MKTSIFTLTISVLVLVSCSTPVEEMTDTAITKVKSQLLDPKSFQLIETKVDTLTYTWSLASKIDSIANIHSLWMKECNKMLDDAKLNHAYGLSASSELRYAQIYLDSAKTHGTKMDVLQKQMTSIKDTPKDSIIGYTVDVRYYATNRGGNKTMGENRYYVFNNGKTNLEDISPLTSK